MEFYEDRGPKILKADTRSLKNKNLKDKVVQEHISNDFTVDTIVEEPSNNLTATEESSEALYPKMARRSLSDGDALAEEKTGRKSVEMSSKTDDAVTSALKHNCVEIASVKEKVCITDISSIEFWQMKPYALCDMCQLMIPCLLCFV